MLKFVESEGWEIGKSTINLLYKKYGKVGELDYDLQYTKLHYARPFDGQTCLDESALSVETNVETNSLLQLLKPKLETSKLYKVFSLEVWF